MPDLSFLRDGLVGVLEEPDNPDGTPATTIRVAGVVSPLSCVFRSPSAPGVVAGVPVHRKAPEILVAGVEWDAKGAHVGALVTVRGVEYAIASSTRNAADVVKAALRESR